MNFLAKIIRGDKLRKTRFNTEADEFCGWSAIPGLFPAAISWVRQKITGIYALKPWWVYSAISIVNRSLDDKDRVLEIGGGYSSIWVAQRVRDISIVEENDAWAKAILSVARENNVDNLNVEVSESLSGAVRFLDKRMFSVVIIDGPQNRMEIFNEILCLKNKPKLIIFDDTDKSENRYASSLGAASGYGVHVYKGFKPQTVHACETTIFTLI